MMNFQMSQIDSKLDDSALVIIDMQPEFQQHFNSVLIEKIVEKITLFKSKNLPIILVEYMHCGTTIYEIMSHLYGYQNLSVIEKNKDDGSDVLYTELSTFKKIPQKLFFTGVFFNCCVRATVGGLRNIFIKNKILKKKLYIFQDSVKMECRNIDILEYHKQYYPRSIRLVA